MKIFRIGVLFLIIALPLTALTIKIGSVAPADSPWDNALKSLAAEWTTISDGEIMLKAYMGGIAGDETDLIRKIRLGQLQAAAITELGLNRITKEVLALNVPFLIRDEDEYDFVLEKTLPLFNSLAEKAGFTVLSWIKAGWVHFFSKKPVIFPKDLKKQTLAVPHGDPEILHAWQELGFNAVSLSLTDYMLGLQSGMVDAFYAPPMVAAAFQWFGFANHMCSLRITPVLAAIIIDRDVWRRISDDLKPDLIEAIRKAEQRLFQDTEELNEEAVAVMREYGLIINRVSEEAEAAWRDMTDAGFRLVVGKSFSEETYNIITGFIGEYRTQEF
jgi:TRAP-type C4-dicarboxylate transport system substrate-binding protein